MSKIQDWINGAPGRSMNPDNALGLQCKDVVDDFCIYLFGNWVNTIRPANAKDAYDRANPDYFEKLPPNAAVQPGDIPVWNGNLGGGFGHIAVIRRALGAGFEVIQQDGFVNTQPARVVTWYNRNNLIGILRPKVASEQIGDTVDLETAKIIAEALAGRDPNDPANIADLQKNHVGKPMAQDIRDWKNSPEHADWKRYQTDSAYRGYLQRPAEKGGLDNYQNKTVRFTNTDIANSAEGKDVSAKYNLIRDLSVAQVKKLVDQKDVPAPGGIDQATKDQISETNSNVKKLLDWFGKIFK